MNTFISPTIKTLKLGSDFLMRTQGTGIPTDPSISCGGVCSVLQDLASLQASWNDNPGSNVNDYVVRFTISGTTYNLRDEDATGGTAGCNVTESPAGSYTLDCNQFSLQDGDCGDCSEFVDIELISITDPEGNILQVTGESCQTFAVCPA